MTIDILLLTYNNLPSTKQCIDHLYKHTSDFNLIIVDNNSTDGTIDYLKNIEQDNLILHFSPKNLGCVNGRNFAYTLSKDSEYICLLDNDQYVLDGWVESYMSYINKGYDVVGYEAWKVRPDCYPIKKVGVGESYSYVGCGGMFLKREVIEDIGLFDTAFNPLYFEDPYFCWTAHEAGYKICWNEEKRIYHQPHKLLNAERRVYFNRSLDILRKKWEGKKIPIFNNYIDK